MVLKLFQNFKCLFQNFQFARFFGQYFKFGAIFFLNFSKFCAGIAIFQNKNANIISPKKFSKKMKPKAKKIINIDFKNQYFSRISTQNSKNT